MQNILRIPRHIKLYAAVALMAALVVTVLAVSFAAGPAQAQNVGNTFDDPQPCGPGLKGNLPTDPDDQITTGRVALFEAYWHWATERTPEDVNSKNTGSLNNNECPPKIEQSEKTVRNIKTVTTTRLASNIDISETVIHVSNDYLVDVVAKNVDNPENNKLSLEEYVKVGDAVSAGTQVYWLRLDDPDTTGENKNETSALRLGFSTLLLDGKYWEQQDDLGNRTGTPLQYELEAVRTPGTDPKDLPHVFAYRAPGDMEEEGKPKLEWDSIDTDTNEVQMEADEYQDLQWVFTKPGTYVLSVHFKGYVKRCPTTTNTGAGPGSSSDDDQGTCEQLVDKVTAVDQTVTSEVRQYTIQVGPLTLIPQPRFGVNLSVPENSPAGVKVGEPLSVIGSPAGAELEYRLVGHDSDHFKPVASGDPHSVQIVVNEGASLDYEAASAYHLTLQVSDGQDRLGNDDAEFTPDDSYAVNINLEDQAPGLLLSADRAFPRVGEPVLLAARYEPTAQRLGQAPSYQLTEQIQTNNGVRWHAIGSPSDTPTWSVSQSSATTKTYRAAVVREDDSNRGTLTEIVNSNEVTIFWEN